MDNINQLIATRELIVKLLNSMDEEKLLTIPEGYNNHVLWNFGHLAITQLLLTYKLSGLDLPVSDSIVKMYGKGSSPKDWPENWNDMAPIPQVKSWLTEFPQKLKEDFDQGIFKNYQPYTTSAGVTLESIEDAIRFNNFHEGIHLGYVMSLKHLI